MKRPLRSTLLVAALALALTGSSALANATETSPDAQVLTSSFLAHHPDLKHRLAGIEAHEAGKHEEAFREFQAAARYADKAAQAMVAEMLWHGKGVARDRPTAYAWMDLAAERLYPSFLALRERYWAQLDADEQQRAIEVGQAIYAEYGDDVAKPRLEKHLNRGRKQVTGSRVGFAGALTVHVPSADGSWTTIDGSTYFADRYWQPKDYFAWQDEVWRQPPTGRVAVGPLGTEADDASGTRDD